MTAFSPTFFKYHGNGNDFIIFDVSNSECQDLQRHIIKETPKLCDRNHGIGADGVIVLEGAKDCWYMTVINRDGTLANNCGNGLRCAAAYIFKHYEPVSTLKISLAEQLFSCEKSGDEITVVMGDCLITRLHDVFLETCQSHAQVGVGVMGNEHLLILLDRPTDAWSDIVNEVHVKIRDHERYNINIMFRDERNGLFSKVYERGVGFTMSCGSGACAAASFLTLIDEEISNPIMVNQPGGIIGVSVVTLENTAKEGSFSLKQQGPAVEVFMGICQAPRS